MRLTLLVASYIRSQFGYREGDRRSIPTASCDWPPPLYPQNGRKPSASVASGLRKLRRVLQKHRRTTFSYIDSGMALGVYRDGGMVPGDSDIDVRWGSSVPVQRPKGLDPLFSLNDYARWGDKWTRRVLHAKHVSEADVAAVWQDLCLHPVVGYYMHRSAMQRRALERTYGAAWFVRMPFKGFPSLHQFYVKPGWWTRSLAIVRRMDANKDGAVQVAELNAWVKQEGIRAAQYDQQISPRDRCRAAATLTFLLEYDHNPFPIPLDALARGDEHPLLQRAVQACR